MSDPSPLPPPEPVYEAIEATLSGHERGRRFLAEHARRSRHQETAALLDAVARLHERSAATAIPAGLTRDLATLRDLTAAAEASLMEATGPRRSDEDTVVEGIQETAWSMREAGTDASFCDLLDGLAARLAMACRGQEQRDLALDRARDALGRLSLHLAGLESGSASPVDDPDASESEGGVLADPHHSSCPDGDPPIATPHLPDAAPTRPKRKSRPRSAE